MKTTSISNLALAVVVAVFASFQVSAAVAASGNKTEMIKHKNEWMPLYQLPEVEVTAAAVQLVEAKEVNNKIIPVVQLKEVVVKATGAVDVEPVTIQPAKPQGYRLEARKVNGSYMPVNDLAAVTVVSEVADKEPVAVVKHEGKQTNEKKVFTISARKSFDMIVNLMVEKAMGFMKSFINRSK